LQAAGRRRLAAAPAAEFVGEEPRMAFQPPFRTTKIPEERGRHEDLTRGLGEVGEMRQWPSGGGERWRRCSAAAALWRGRRGREGRGVERRSWRTLYRA
jgi:hypothetical protein